MTIWNPADKHANVVLSETNKVATVVSSTTGHSARANKSHTAGKKCWGMEVITKGTWIIFGFSQTGHTDMTRAPGLSGSVSWGAHPAGNGYYHAVSFSAGATAGQANSDFFVVGVDFSAGSIHLWKNGTAIDSKYSNLAGALFPHVGLYTGSSARGYFLGNEFPYAVPSGWEAWDGNFETPRLLTADRRAIKGVYESTLTPSNDKYRPVITNESGVIDVDLVGATATPTDSKIAKFGASSQLTALRFVGSGGGNLKLHAGTLADNASTTFALSGNNGRCLLRIVASTGARWAHFFAAGSSTIEVASSSASGINIGTSSDPGDTGDLNVWLSATATLSVKNYTNNSISFVIEELYF